MTLVRGESGAYEPRPSSGGLATALWPLHREGEGLWLGWPGHLPESGGERRRARSGLRAARLLPVSLKPEIERDFYHGFANTTLWPLLHYRPHLARLEDRWWEAYQAANRAFARAVLRVARADDTIWLHDYHLMLVPRLLRRRLPTARIGFFLHTPFPSSEVFRILPWRRELLDGLLGADLVGFQVYDYLRHFRRTVSLVLGVENDGEPLWVGDRQVSTGVFPIGIDPDRFCDCSRSDPAAREQLESLRLELGRRRLILGVDRMDYSKGIPERLRGYERLLERHPSLHGRVELLQIGVPSREEVDDYRSLRQDVEAIVGRINGRFGTPEWTPVKYLYRPVAFPHLCALYRHAAVALVTPLRDGMNLVAKEYVAAQRGGDGVLVLSEFAGSAAELAEAVHVNPYDPGAISDAIYTALTLPRQERMERMAALVRRVWAGRVSRWAGRFLEALDRASTRQEPFPPRLTGSARTELLAEWSAAAGRLVMLDYDGTLTEFTLRPELARPDAELLDLLRRLARLPGVMVAIVSGRDAGTLGRWLGSLGLLLVAEHGRWIRHPGQEWTDLLDGSPPSWLGQVREILEDAAAAVPGALVEEKSAAVAWHYRTASAELAARYLPELVRRLQEVPASPPLDLLPGNKVLEVRVAGISKAAVLSSVLAAAPPTDLIIAIGDDQTDEEMFGQLAPRSWTVHVGSRPSRARCSLPDPRATRELLISLVRSSEEARE